MLNFKKKWSSLTPFHQKSACSTCTTLLVSYAEAMVATAEGLKSTISWDELVRQLSTHPACADVATELLSTIKESIGLYLAAPLSSSKTNASQGSSAQQQKIGSLFTSTYGTYGRSVARMTRMEQRDWAKRQAMFKTFDTAGGVGGGGGGSAGVLYGSTGTTI